VLDMEHGVIGPEACNAVVAHCRAAGLTVYVRVAAAERRLIQHALDYGADGVMLPQNRRRCPCSGSLYVRQISAPRDPGRWL
jgi:2-keto-3-deoxy-L-rhamnonate aldolase RhmA